MFSSYVSPQFYSRNHVAILAAGAVLAAWYLSTPAPSETSNKINRRKETTGIKRAGVTCYLNTVLQVLCTSDRFISYLRDVNRSYVEFKSKDSDGPSFFKLHILLSEIVSKLQGDLRTIYINTGELRHLESLLGMRLLEQCDWLEIFGRIAQILEAERTAFEHRLKSNVECKGTTEEESSSNLKHLPFYGILATTAYCFSCKNPARSTSTKMTENEKVFSLSVDMTDSRYEKDTFQERMIKSMCEEIESYSCSFCSLKRKLASKSFVEPFLKKKFEDGDIRINDELGLAQNDLVKTTLVRTSKFVEFPEMLQISLNRFKCTRTGLFTRITDIYCDFPKHLTLYGHTYRLNNLVSHAGGVKNGGHYQVYSKKPPLIKNKYKAKETGKLALVAYELMNTVAENSASTSLPGLALMSSKKYDPFEKDLNDYWLINDQKCRQASLLYDINPSASHSITGLVYELID